MTPTNTRRAALVMLASLKKGAVVEYVSMSSVFRKIGWTEHFSPVWDWFSFDYRIKAKTKKRKRK